MGTAVISVDAATSELLEAIAAPVFVVELDGDGQPVFAALNAAFCRLAGVDACETLGKGAMAVFPGRVGRLMVDHQVDVFATRTGMSHELSLTLQDQTRQVRVHLNPILGQFGAMKRLICTCDDITTEVELREAQSNTAAMSTEIEQFISMAAHDLRSPVRNVSQIAEMLREDFEDLGDGKLDLIAMLEKIATQSEEMISDILSHARAADVKPTTSEFELSELCQKIFAVLDPMGQHSASFESVRLSGDYTATQIILRNLLDNAIKHNKPNAIMIDISADAVGPDAFQVTVSDDGSGFSEAALEFLDGGKFRKDSGFGMLGIRRLVKARGGAIEIIKADSGAIVKFTMPGRIIPPVRSAYSDELSHRSVFQSHGDAPALP